MKTHILALCLAAAATMHAAEPAILRNARTPEADRWVDSVMATLDARGRIGQLICGKAVPGSGEAARRAIRSQVEAAGVG